MSELAEVIESALTEREMDFTRKDSTHFIVELPGERKLKTTTLLTVGKHGLRVEAFVCRKPDENFEGVYKYLLRRNRRLHTGQLMRALPRPCAASTVRVRDAGRIRWGRVRSCS